MHKDTVYKIDTTIGREGSPTSVTGGTPRDLRVLSLPRVDETSSRLVVTGSFQNRRVRWRTKEGRCNERQKRSAGTLGQVGHEVGKRR